MVRILKDALIQNNHLVDLTNTMIVYKMSIGLCCQMTRLQIGPAQQAVRSGQLILAWSVDFCRKKMQMHQLTEFMALASIIEEIVDIMKIDNLKMCIWDLWMIRAVNVQ